MAQTIFTKVVASLLLHYRFPSAAENTAGLFGVQLGQRNGEMSPFTWHRSNLIFPWTLSKLTYGRQGLAGLSGKDTRIHSLDRAAENN